MKKEVCVQCDGYLMVFGEFQTIIYESPKGREPKTLTAGYCTKPECPNYKILQATWLLN